MKVKNRRITIFQKEVNLKEANRIRITASYQKGGRNYFTGSNEKRGYYISVEPITVKDYKDYKTTSYTAFSGVKKFVKEAKRYSEKQLKKTAKQVKITESVKDLLKNGKEEELALACKKLAKQL